MEDKQLKKIAEELTKMNKKWDQLLHQLQQAIVSLSNEQTTTPPAPGFGSTGEAEPSTK